MKIESVEVKKFKSLKDFRVSGFLGVNLVFGLNNSGKSNYLKFLDLLFSRKEKRTTEEYFDENGFKRTRIKIEKTLPFYEGNIYEPFIFWKDERETPIEFSVVVSETNDNFPMKSDLLGMGVLDEARDHSKIKISGEIVSIDKLVSQIILTEVTVANNIVFQNPTKTQGAGIFFSGKGIDSELKGKNELFYGILNSLSDLVCLIDCDRHFGKEQLSADIEALKSDKFKSWIYEQYINSDKYENYTGLINFISNFKIGRNVLENSEGLEKNIANFPLTKTSLGFTQFGDEFELMLDSNGNRFPLSNFGTGIQQIFYILCRIFETNSKVILLEELELNLSPTYQEIMINNLKDIVLDSRLVDQVLFTSHSDYLLREDYGVFHSQIDEEGKTTMHKPNVSEKQKYRRRILKTYTGY